MAGIRIGTADVEGSGIVGQAGSQGSIALLGSIDCLEEDGLLRQLAGIRRHRLRRTHRATLARVERGAAGAVHAMGRSDFASRIQAGD